MLTCRLVVQLLEIVCVLGFERSGWVGRTAGIGDVGSNLLTNEFWHLGRLVVKPLRFCFSAGSWCLYLLLANERRLKGSTVGITENSGKCTAHVDVDQRGTLSRAR